MSSLLAAAIAPGGKSFAGACLLNLIEVVIAVRYACWLRVHDVNNFVILEEVLDLQMISSICCRTPSVNQTHELLELMNVAIIGSQN